MPEQVFLTLQPVLRHGCLSNKRLVLLGVDTYVDKSLQLPE